MIRNTEKKTDVAYGYYSKVLGKPFDSIEELKEAETEYFDKQKAKENAAAKKKADAQKVEAAFKALNAARKEYKEKNAQLATEYAESLNNLKKAFDLGCKDIHNTLASAEEAYQAAIKEFTAKHPEGFHLTLRDGDFETTISGQTTGDTKAPADFSRLAELFDLMFRF